MSNPEISKIKEKTNDLLHDLAKEFQPLESHAQLLELKDAKTGGSLL